MYCSICGKKVQPSQAHYVHDTVRNSRSGKLIPIQRPICPGCASALRENMKGDS